MKAFPLTILAALVITAAVFIGFYAGTKICPMRHLLRTAMISRVKIEGRTLRAVVQDIVNQVEAADGKGRKLSVVFSSQKLGEKTQVVFGNPPVEGTAEHALYLVGADFNCYFSGVEERTILCSEDPP